MPITDDDRAVDTRGGPLTQYKPLLRRFGIRLCVSVTLALMVLAAVELYSYKRYRNYGQNDVLEPGAKLELQENGTAAEREYWKEFEQSNKVMYHQYVLWRRAPYQGDMISINPEGVRRTLHTQCDEKTLTIWMYGDSVMWGGGAPDAETIPSLIALDYEKAGKPVCIVNYGEKGWSNTQEMVALIEQLKHASRKPDIVLFYDGGTEAFAAYQSGQADVHSNYGMFKDFLDNWGAKQRASFDYLRETNTYRLLAKIASQSPLHRKEEHEQKSHLDVEALSSAVIDNYK
ncbi:MAG TPA: SGNH/GDSL hydrolase family protein, partial [Candidatus Sulfotelmatobacter sp.]|nr:SGNH/GDSL hydrolase family protein [Candidatus Sulfotelmatobacter sp.]